MNSIRKHIKFGATAEVRDPLGNGGQPGATLIEWAGCWVFRRGTGRPHLLEDGTRRKLLLAQF